jgi:hypothetical protein
MSSNNFQHDTMYYRNLCGGNATPKNQLEALISGLYLALTAPNRECKKDALYVCAELCRQSTNEEVEFAQNTASFFFHHPTFPN